MSVDDSSYHDDMSAVTFDASMGSMAPSWASGDQEVVGTAAQHSVMTAEEASRTSRTLRSQVQNTKRSIYREVENFEREMNQLISELDEVSNAGGATIFTGGAAATVTAGHTHDPPPVTSIQLLNRTLKQMQKEERDNALLAGEMRKAAKHYNHTSPQVNSSVAYYTRMRQFGQAPLQYQEATPSGEPSSLITALQQSNTDIHNRLTEKTEQID